MTHLAGIDSTCRLTLAEAGVLGAVASGLGVLAGLVQLGSLREVSGILFGLAPPFRLVWLPRPAIVYSLLATAAVLVGGAWPAWRTTRVRVVEALRHD
jgi:putative ABC transport system permease protein